MVAGCETLSLDSGATKHGYIGDLARIAVIGLATNLMPELLEEVDSVGMSGRRAMKLGALCTSYTSSSIQVKPIYRIGNGSNSRLMESGWEAMRFSHVTWRPNGHVRVHMQIGRSSLRWFYRLRRPLGVRSWACHT